MRRKNLDLIVVLIIAGLNVVRVLLHANLPVVGIILALPLVLVLPGYTLTELLFRKRSLNAAERLVFSLGLSLAIDILSGLFLNLFPIGLQATSWVMLLGLLTVVFSLQAGNLRRKVPVSGGQTMRFRLNIYQGILFVLAIATAILSLVYAAIGTIEQPHPGFTQLWMLPEVQVGKNCAVRLGVRSFESTSVRYHLTITANGNQVATPPSIFLTPQEEWDRLVLVTPSTSNEIYVEVRLYRVDKPESVYREVHWTFSNVKASKDRGTRQCGMPNPSSSLALASTYKGTIYDIPTNLRTTMSLTSIQQSGGHISGHFTASAGLLRGGALRGTAVSTKDIQFTVTDNAGHAVLSFDGALGSDGTLAGTYCNLDQGGQCSGDYGLWSVTPTSTGL